MRNQSNNLIRQLRWGALLAIAFFPVQLLATHLVGGDISYRYISETADAVTYEITLNVYRDCRQGTEPFDNPAFISIYDGLGNLRRALINLRFRGEVVLDRPLNGPCFIDPGDVCVSRTQYAAVVTLPKNPAGGYYHIIYERCCRNSTINNIIDPLETGQVFDIVLTQQAIDLKNNSPSFSALPPQWPPIFICTNVDVDFDHSAFDLDGDSLVYELCTPLSAATQSDPKPIPGTPTYFDPDEITEVAWNGPLYELDNMLGAENPEDRLKIDGVTGRLTALPTVIGQFVVGVCVKEYDRETGILLSTTRRDFQYNVRDCGNVASAFTAPEDKCGLTVGFSNESANADRYIWFFDYPNNQMTSNELFPTVTYPAPGIYQVQLIAIQAEICRDTIIRQVTVVENTIDIAFDTTSVPCGENAVLVLSDKSVGLESPIVAWAWSVGNGDGTVQTSTEQNPFFIVPEETTDTITLTVTAENGCQRTLARPYRINRRDDPAEKIDELIQSCRGEVLFLNPKGDPKAPFSYRWSPGNLVSDSTAINPRFTGTESAVVTVFIESLDDNRFCNLTKTINITINKLPDLDLGSAALIACEGQTFTLTSGADLTQDYAYQWTGPNGFSSTEPEPLFPDAGVEVSGTYFVTVTDNVTGCDAEATYRVEFFPKPVITLTPVDPSTCKVDDGQLIIGGLTPGESYTVAFSKDGGDAGMVEATADNNGFIRLDNLSVGAYEISVTNALGCTSAPELTSLENPRVEVNASDTQLCEGGTLTLLSTVTGGSGNYTYSWTGPGGFTSAVDNPVLENITPAQSGTYALIVTDLITECVSRVKSVDILINPNPQVSVRSIDPSSCLVGDGQIVVEGLTPGASYTLNLRRDGAPIGTQTITADGAGAVLLTGLGVGKYDVEVIDAEGCSSGLQAIALENPKVELSASDETPCEGGDLQLFSTVTGGSGRYTYAWTGPAGFTSSAANPLISGLTLAQSGTYTLVVTDAETNCVSDQKSIDIAVNPAPQISLTPIDPSTCRVNDGSIVIGSLTPGAAYGVSVSRDGGAPATQTATANAEGQIILTDLSVGQYDVKISDENDCGSVSRQTTLESPRAVVSASGTEVCEGEDLQLFSTVTGGSGQYAYAWTGPGGFTSTAANPLVSNMTAAKAGTYTLVVTDTGTNCVSDEKSIDIAVNPAPQISLTPNDPSACQVNDGSIVIGSLTPGATYGVSVSRDGGAPATQTATANAAGEIILTGLGVGAYDVKVTDDKDCGSASQQTTLESPRVVVGAAGTEVCEGGDLQLFSTVTGGSGQYAYAWTGPDGFVSAEPNPLISAVTPAQGGTYTLVVTDSGTNCVSDEKSIDITINPAPQISLTPVDPSACQVNDGSIVVGGLTPGATYTVSVSKDGAAAATQTASADANGQIALANLGVGKYEVKVTDGKDCGSASQQTTLESPRVVVSALGTELCEGGDLQLRSTVTGGSGQYAYAWTGPEGFTSDQPNPLISGITSAQAGTYTLVVTDTGTNCVSDEKSIDIMVFPTLQISLTPNDPSACQVNDGAIAIGKLISGATYTVSVSQNGGAPATQTTTADANGRIILTDLGVGAYEIDVTDERGCNSGPQQTTLESPRVVVSASGTELCEGENLQLRSTVTGGSGQYVYSWTGPDGFASDQPNPLIRNVAPAQSGTYTLVVTDAGTNCVSDEKSIDITVNPNPRISLTPNDPSACQVDDGNIVIGGLTPGATYTVSVSQDGGAPAEQSLAADANGEITLTGLGVGAYEIAVTDANGCAGAPQQTTLESPRVEVSASGTELCEGEDLQLNATVTGGSGQYTYSWTGPDGFTSDQPNPLVSGVTPNQSGTYTLVVTDTGTNCVSDEKSIDIIINPNPRITLAPNDPSACQLDDGSIVISGLTPGATYTISVSLDGGAPAERTLAADANGQIALTGLGVGKYEIEVIDANGCASGPQQTTLESPRVVVSASGTELCEGEDLQLNSTVTGGSGQYVYAWTGPDGFTSTAANPLLSGVTPAQSGTYTLVVTDTGTNCVSDEKSIDITVNPTPQISLTPNDPSACQVNDGSIFIDGLTPGATYTINVSLDGGAPAAQTLAADASGRITLTGLGVGKYEIEAIEASGCAGGPQQTTLESPRVEVSAANTGLCEGENLELISTVTGGSGQYAYVWTGPAGFSSTEASPTLNSVVPAQAGTYTLVVTDTGTNCVSDPKSVDVTVNPKPAFTLAGTDPTTCTDQDGQIVISGLLPDSLYVVNVSRNGAAPQSIDGQANAAGEIELTALGDGTYRIGLAINGGCAGDEMEIILELPESPSVTVSAEDTELCEGEPLRLISQTSGGSGAYLYQWTGPGGFSSTEPNPVIPSVTEANEGGYVLVVTDAETNCASPEARVDITVNPTPEIELRVVDPSTCGAGDGQIVIGGLTPGERYDVSFTAEGVSVTLPGQRANDAGEIVLSGLSAGTFRIAVSSLAECFSNEQEATLTDPEPPVLTIEVSDPTPCEDDVVTFSVSGTGGTPPYRFSWSGPNGFASTAINPQLAAATLLDSGTYAVTVTDAKNCTATASVSIEVLEREEPPTLEATPVSTCGGNDGTLVILNLAADTVYGVSINGAAPVDLTADADGRILFEDLPAGTYEVTLTGSNGCVSDPSSATIEEPEKPSIDPTADPAEVCEMESLQLRANVAGGTEPYTITWTGPNGFSSNEANPVVPDMAPNKAGAYNVEVVDANNCSASGSVVVSIKQAPEIMVSGTDPTTCGGDDGFITIAGLMPGVAYELIIGDQNFAGLTANSAGEITRGGFSAGNYPITVVGENDCSSAQAQVSLSDPEAPTARIVASDETPCEGDALELLVAISGGAGPFTINWTGPNGFPATTTEDTLIAAVSLDNAGTYTVEVTDANNCMGAASLEISVREKLDITATGTGPTTCGGQDGTITIGGLEPDSTYLIDIDGQALTGTGDANGEATFDGWSAGSYNVTVEGLNGCPSSNVMVSLSDPESPAVTVSAADTTLCAGDVLLLMSQISGGTPGYGIDWTGPNGFTSMEQNPSIDAVGPMQGGTYVVKVTDMLGCTASAAVNVEVNESPSVEITPDADTICTAEKIALQANITGGTPGYSIRWYELPRGNEPFDSLASTMVMPGVGMTAYQVEVTDTNGCVALDTAVVNFFPIDAMLNPMDTVLCDPVDELLLSVNNKDPRQQLTYEWSPAGAIITDPADGPVIMVDPMVANTFSVRLENQFGCRDTLSTTVTVSTLRDELEISIEPAKIAPGQSMTITVTGCAECEYSWSPNTSDTGPVVTVTPSQTTTYSVTVTDPNGCEYELSIMAMVVPCSEENFFVPSAFTPNGDRVNDMLCVRSQLEVNPEAVEMIFIVFNRWGEKVFESNSLTDCWDGTYRGQPLPPDVYGWYLKVTCPEGSFEKKGNVTLLR